MKTEKQHTQAILCFVEENKELKKQIAELKDELKQAKDLTKILDKITSITVNDTGFVASGGTWSTELNLPDNVLVYVDDILGGKVIKQEGVKCLVIEADGSVKTGLTKQKRDTGFTYKLVRQ